MPRAKVLKFSDYKRKSRPSDNAAPELDDASVIILPIIRIERLDPPRRTKRKSK